jgi:hypothetical protein
LEKKRRKKTDAIHTFIVQLTLCVQNDQNENIQVCVRKRKSSFLEKQLAHDLDRFFLPWLNFVLLLSSITLYSF